MGPVVAPTGTCTLNDVELLERTTDAGTPLNFTTVVGPSGPSANDVPVITTVEPGDPIVGEKLVIVGGGAAVTVKLPALVPVPTALVTAIGPVVAANGTCEMMIDVAVL